MRQTDARVIFEERRLADRETSSPDIFSFRIYVTHYKHPANTPYRAWLADPIFKDDFGPRIMLGEGPTRDETVVALRMKIVDFLNKQRAAGVTTEQAEIYIDLRKETPK